MRRRLLVVAAIISPLLLGALLSALLELDILPNLLLVGEYAVSFSGIASRAGLLLSLVVAGGAGLWWWLGHRVESAREALREEQVSARRRFLQRLDHELKNPLTIIRLGITNLQHGAAPPEEQRASLERIAQQVQRLGRLIVDLRWLGELDERDVEHRPVDLQQLLAEAVSMVEEMPEYKRRPVDVTVQQVPWPVAAVRGDRDLLLVVFRNLVDNALKHTQAADRVEVRVSDDGQAAIVEIADTGPGIPEEEIPHIFEELFRGESARAVPGSGLGLALVQRIILLHGGAISVRSRVGRGTMIVVRLPLAPQTSPQPAA
ncbi:MAG: HAMP domain-containing sensor histidine kinase [Candidatus Promineifilaceae bacterium]|nr:HAMP domain-containing sensor histidine kinase [Candidatus Promineifilaceae bacterium]